MGTNWPTYLYLPTHTPAYLPTRHPTLGTYQVGSIRIAPPRRSTTKDELSTPPLRLRFLLKGARTPPFHRSSFPISTPFVFLPLSFSLSRISSACFQHSSLSHSHTCHFTRRFCSSCCCIHFGGGVAQLSFRVVCHIAAVAALFPHCSRIAGTRLFGGLVGVRWRLW